MMFGNGEGCTDIIGMCRTSLMFRSRFICTMSKGSSYMSVMGWVLQATVLSIPHFVLKMCMTLLSCKKSEKVTITS